MMVQHVEHLDELALVERYVPEVLDCAPIRCGDRYISEEDTSIWDPSSVGTSRVDMKAHVGTRIQVGHPIIYHRCRMIMASTR